MALLHLRASNGRRGTRWAARLNLAQAIVCEDTNPSGYSWVEGLITRARSVLALELGRPPIDAYFALHPTATRPLGMTQRGHLYTKQHVYRSPQQEAEIAESMLRVLRQAWPNEINFIEICARASLEASQQNRRVLGEQIGRKRVIAIGEGKGMNYKINKDARENHREQGTAS